MHVAIENLSQRTSVFTERALKFESLKHSLVYEKSISQSVILDAIVDAKKTQSLYEAICPETEQPLLTTPWLLTLEAETIARIENNKGMVNAIATKRDIEQFQKERTSFLVYPMTASQRDAMFILLTSQDRYLAIQGYAGVAKTTMLSEARLLMIDKGYHIRGITVASSAAHELKTKAGVTSDVFPAVHQELKEAKTGSLSKTVFIVDEASMLSSPQGHELIKQIERTQARLVLVGDRAQLPSVNNGRIFGLIQDYGVETATVNEIVRQKNLDLKNAVISATLGDVKTALEKLDIQELPTHEARIQWIASRWLSLSTIQREETLLFAPTHKDRIAITKLIRNGEVLVVQAIQSNHLVFTTKDGQPFTLEKNHSALKHLDYSYVLTNYKVQGKDAPYGIGLMESYHRFGATMKNFYVQISRAIHGMTLVTDNKEQLVEAIQRNNDEKPAALDMVSIQQLRMHESKLSIQTVIDKKIQFEHQAQELNFTKVSHQKSVEYIKELER